MSRPGGWAGPEWGEPSAAARNPALLRGSGTAATASYRADGGGSEEFLVLAASVGGVSHRLAGRRCEDSFGWATPRPGLLALVVADGVGSAGRGGEGAELAVEAACRYLGGRAARGWGTALCREAISEASEALYRARSGRPAELAATIVVALLRANAGRVEVTLGRVGDSSAFVLSPDGEWRELFGVSAAGTAGDEQAAGEEVTVERDADMLVTSTASLPLPPRDASAGSARRGPSAASPLELRSGELGPGEAIVLLTDGVAEPLRDGPATVAPNLAEALRHGRDGELGPLGLAGAVDFSRRGAHDDRTVLVAWALAGEG